MYKLQSLVIVPLFGVTPPWIGYKQTAWTAKLMIAKALKKNRDTEAGRDIEESFGEERKGILRIGPPRDL